MKRKLSIVALLCLVSSVMNGCASHSQMEFQRERADPQEIELLINLLGSHDSDYRFYAATELGKMSTAAQAAVSALIEALDDKKGNVREAAAKALLNIGTPFALRAVREYNKKKASSAGACLVRGSVVIVGTIIAILVGISKMSFPVPGG